MSRPRGEAPPEIAALWRVFRLRVEVSTDPRIGFVYTPTNAVLFPPLVEVVASLLYVDLVSILDKAMAMQMRARDYKRLVTIDRRLQFLDTAGKLLDFAALDAMRRRRNDIAHKVVRLDVAELNAAIATVQAQLEAWGLVGPAPTYERFAGGSGLYDPQRPEYAAARDYRVGVKENGTPALVLTYTVYAHRD